MDDRLFEWFTPTQRVHMGAVLDARTGRRGMDFYPLEINGNEVKGMPFKSNGIDEVIWEGSHYRIPSVRALLRSNWIRKATPEEVKIISGGKIKSTVTESTMVIPDSDEILKNRLEKAGMTASKTSDVQSIAIDKIEKPEMQKTTLGLPEGWNTEAHWTARKRELDKITDSATLMRLQKFYEGSEFKKHVIARIDKVNEQLKRGALPTSKAQPVDRSSDSSKNIPLQGVIVASDKELALAEGDIQPVSFDGLEPGVGPLKKGPRTSKGSDTPVFDSRKMFEKP